jgi:hypothetical protein
VFEDLNVEDCVDPCWLRPRCAASQPADALLGLSEVRFALLQDEFANSSSLARDRCSIRT